MYAKERLSANRTTSRKTSQKADRRWRGARDDVANSRQRFGPSRQANGNYLSILLVVFIFTCMNIFFMYLFMYLYKRLYLTGFIIFVLSGDDGE